MVPDPWMRFISRVEDYMKYKPVEVLIFENQQFRPVLLGCFSSMSGCSFPMVSTKQIAKHVMLVRLLHMIKKLGKRNMKNLTKACQPQRFLKRQSEPEEVCQNLEIMASNLAQA